LAQETQGVAVSAAGRAKGEIARARDVRFASREAVVAGLVIGLAAVAVKAALNEVAEGDVGFILFMLPATIILAYLSWPIFYNSWHMNEISSNAGGLIRWPVKILLPVGFALLTLQGISELIKRIAMITGHMKADLHYERPLQ